MSRSDESAGTSEAALVARHLRLGWWALLFYLSAGIGLEALHGFKLGFYLDLANETRRHLWTLAHAHGALLSILSVVFGLSLRALPHWSGGSREIASRCLIGALVLMPLGFALGGAYTHRGDPGLGILLVPPGGLLLFCAVFLVARASMREA